MPIEKISASEFQNGRFLREGTWVIEFVADWCPFCRRFRPRFATLEGTPDVQLGFADVTSFESPLWEEFAIDVVPVAVVFRAGSVVFRIDAELGLDLPADSVDRLRAAALGGRPEA